jgi:hypothetical protein
VCPGECLSVSCPGQAFQVLFQLLTAVGSALCHSTMSGCFSDQHLADISMLADKQDPGLKEPNASRDDSLQGGTSGIERGGSGVS